MSPTPVTPVEAFIARWSEAGGSERSNYQLFVQELCSLLDLPAPEPAREETRDNAYVFEHRVTFHHGDGTESTGFIDCYRRGAFVLEAKKLRQGSGRGYDEALLRARGQAEQYARSLPATEGRPPFLLVVDVGNVIEVYAEFTKSGATYTPYPDPRTHRIKLSDLAREDVREVLRAVWLDPTALDPSRRSAKVTREVAERLAEVARVLESTGHDPQAVAGFLSRCLFSMFAEDVGLLPKHAFVDLLESLKGNPAQFVPLVGELWRAMDRGEFSAALRADVLRFNGKLFKRPDVLALTRDQIDLLLAAARANWSEVEPSIFGTLLERALNPEERRSLGAHYTPRAYVERLVLPTVVEPLREDWRNAQAAALLLASEGDVPAALSEIKAFHKKLCSVRVLDPACGSGNFLYVALEHLKRLEGEVLNAFDELDPARQAGRLRQGGLALGAERANPFGDETVDPHQLLGIELNPRAAEIAEMVLWIGYLQWHFRTRGETVPPQPVLKDFRNIECRDAVLAYDRMEYATDDRGVPVTRWDGITFKTHAVTGEEVPDEFARAPLERYINPRKADWPNADFVLGNPPFIGASNVRRALGDGYADALRENWTDVPESADFVMHWWDHAAELTRTGKLRRFGLITTNSLRQTFNRRVLERHLNGSSPMMLAFAIPDHPWVDSSDGAAVRIAMTVGTASKGQGRLLRSMRETAVGDGAYDVMLEERRGIIHPDLRIGANVASAKPLRANEELSSPGVKLHGSGFIITRDQALTLGVGITPDLDSHVREYRNGRDLTDRPRDVLVIDLFGLQIEEVRSRFPSVYQWVLERVKPERDHNNRAAYRDRWWIFGEPRSELRPLLAGLNRYVATVETAKHRTFQFLDKSILPDNMLIAIGLDDAYFLGVLSSRTHVVWALATGGTLEDRPRYNKTRCFETFPFPTATPEQQAHIRRLSEQLDAHRKRQQAAHRDLTLTEMYNVLEKLRAGEPLTRGERDIHEKGLVGVLKSLHDELDRAVLDIYGWNDLSQLMEAINGNVPLPSSSSSNDGAQIASVPQARRVLDDSLLTRLVSLNAERAAQERKGNVRWLRPEFQHPEGHAATPTQVPIDEEHQTAAAKRGRMTWPSTLPDQVRAVAGVIAASGVPLSYGEIELHFNGRGRWRKRLPQIIETLIAAGRVRSVREGSAFLAAQ